MKFLTNLSLLVLIIGLASCSQDSTCTCEIAGETTTSTCEGCSGDDLEAFEAACLASDAIAQLAGGNCSID